MHKKDQISHVQQLQNCRIRITKLLHKFDHVTSHRRELNWLPVSQMVQCNL